ncbi:MAG TPA: TRAP transporter substrate-binding protein [Stellaceae bacterium]|nr:TRAP transporter substrate-binding protein [Stellaceae bacterium]
MRASRIGVAVGFVIAAAAVLAAGAARAADQPPIVMKITLPTINDALNAYSTMLGAAVERHSGGRIKAEVYPASQLGSIPRQIEGVQFGSIQVAVMPPEFYVGVDERFEVLTAPGLVDSMEQAHRVTSDPAVQKLMLGLGANKGLHGLALFSVEPSAVITRQGIRHLDDFKGKKIRIFASDFQSEAMKRLGATPIAMTLGDVLPAIQQGTIDGAIAGMAVFAPMHYQDAARFVTETGQPHIFIIVETSQRWFDGLPKDLQKIVADDATEDAKEIYPVAIRLYADQRKQWLAQGGELLKLPPDDQATMLKTLSTVAEDVSKSKPAVHAAYETVLAAAKQAP